MNTTQDGLLTAAEQYAHTAGFTDEMMRVHAAARERFASLEWPSQSEEEWRRTSLGTVGLTRFRVPTSSPTVVSVPPRYKDAVTVYSGVSDLQRLPAERFHALQTLMTERISTADNRFILWPYLFLADVTVIDVSKPIQATEPITLTTVVSNDECFSAPLVCVLSCRDAELQLLHTFTSGDDTTHLCVSDSLMILEDCARVRCAHLCELNINSYHFSNGQVFLRRDSTLRHGVVSIGGLLSKMRYDVHLIGVGAEAYLDGIYLGYEDQHHDLRTLQVHDAPSTKSFALYRGVVLDEAHTIYQGLIKVTERAKGTDAYLTNNNLLLSDEARADSIPSLNISTDEVKCSHGSTTGKVDPVQLFYLQSRGMSFSEARAMLVEGFVEEVLQRFPAQGGERVRSVIGERIANL